MINPIRRLRTPVVTGNNAVTKPCPKPVFQAPDGLLLLVTKPRPKQRYYIIGAGQAERSVVASPNRREATADEHGSVVGSARLSAALRPTCIQQSHQLAPKAARPTGARCHGGD